jgi:hypothetical protein
MFSKFQDFAIKDILQIRGSMQPPPNPHLAHLHLESRFGVSLADVSARLL